VEHPNIVWNVCCMLAGSYTCYNYVQILWHMSSFWMWLECLSLSSQTRHDCALIVKFECYLFFLNFWLLYVVILTGITIIPEAQTRCFVCSCTADSPYCCKYTHSLKVNVCCFVLQDAASTLESKKRGIGATCSQVWRMVH